MFLHVQEPGGGDMTTSYTKPTHPHGITELCEEGGRLYASALRSGRIARAEVAAAPCLIDFALLHPDPDDADWLRPVPPSAALAKHLHPLEREILERRRRSVLLTESFEPYMDISAQDPPTTHAITVLEGANRINAALDLATAECRTEVLTVQPGAAGARTASSRPWSGACPSWTAVYASARSTSTPCGTAPPHWRTPNA